MVNYEMNIVKLIDILNCDPLDISLNFYDNAIFFQEVHHYNNS